MRRKVGITLVALVMAFAIGTAAFAATQTVGQISVPMNGNSLYRVDPDDSVSSVRNKAVTKKTSVAKFAKNGFVTGSAAKQHLLGLGFESSNVAVYTVTILDINLVPEEARELDAASLAVYMMGLVTRIERNATTLNVEKYDSRVHSPVVKIQVGTKDSEYWIVFLRNDGVWTLCLKGSGGGTIQPTATPTTAPTATPTPPSPSNTPTPVPTADPTPTPTPIDVDPTPVWEEDPTPTPTSAPTEEPWDPGFNWTPTPTATPKPTPTPVDVDPTPVWEDDPTPAPTAAPTEEPWDPGFNFSQPTATPYVTPDVDPTPVWDNDPAPSQNPSTDADPAPVWDNDPSPQWNEDTNDGWDEGFNF